MERQGGGAAPARPVLVTGATGLVGFRLVRALAMAGVPVRALSRDATRAQQRFEAAALAVTAFAWDGTTPPPAALEGAGAIVHLAGEPVFGGLLTAARRAAIRDSRVRSTERLVEALAAFGPGARPEVLVSASAVGFYGDRGDALLSEQAGPGEGFLAEVCVAWERAALRAEALGLRVVVLRIGIVLAREGGALPLMALPIRFGVGGALGSGRQFVPWIHADDLVALTRRALDDARLRGPVNAVAPEPVRNAALTKAIAAHHRRPAFLRVPAFAVRLALGAIAGELLGSRRVVPAKALDVGFAFAHGDLAGALAREL